MRNVTKLLCTASVSAVLCVISAACSEGNPDGFGVEFLGVASTDDANICSYSADGEERTIEIFMDTYTSSASLIQLRFRNNLTESLIELPGGDPQEFWLYANALTASRLEYRWECDSSTFGANSPLIVPRFSGNRPFCVDTRSEDADFSGFDVIPVTSNQMDPGGGRAIVSARVVPFALRNAINESLEIADLADQCCTDVGGCQNLAAAGFDPASFESCDRLDQIFGALNVQDPSGTQRFITNPDDVAPFASYGYTSGDQDDWELFVNSAGNPPPLTSIHLGHPLPVILRGKVIFTSSQGSEFESKEFTVKYNFYRRGAFTTACTDF